MVNFTNGKGPRLRSPVRDIIFKDGNVIQEYQGVPTQYPWVLSDYIIISSIL